MAAYGKTPIRSLPPVPAPTPHEIRTARKTAGCTAREAAIAVYVPTSYWTEAEKGARKLHPALAELFARKYKLGIYKDNID